MKLHPQVKKRSSEKLSEIERSGLFNKVPVDASEINADIEEWSDIRIKNEQRGQHGFLLPQENALWIEAATLMYCATHVLVTAS
jgi:hypothetical protein